MDFLGAENYKKQPIQQEIFAAEVPLINQEKPILLNNGEYVIITKDNKDKGQREFCGCIKSKDIGEYDTCPHLCEYCYANTSKETAVRNYKQHLDNPLSETITGK